MAIVREAPEVPETLDALDALDAADAAHALLKPDARKASTTRRRTWLRAAGGVMLALAAPQWAHAAEVDVWRLGGLWDDDDGQRLTMAAWSGRRALLTMAYGSCRKTCSATLRFLQQAQAQADARGLALEVIVVGLDPTIDTPTAWRQYRDDHALHRTNWHFLGGSPALTRRLAAVLSMRYWPYDDHILHDFRIAAVDPAGRIVARLDGVDEAPGTLVDALARG
jgi:cytochrome oxidase Cu insertion factor (SCO1/SenC/PrrC family)